MPDLIDTIIEPNRIYIADFRPVPFLDGWGYKKIDLNTGKTRRTLHTHASETEDNLRVYMLLTQEPLDENNPGSAVQAGISLRTILISGGLLGFLALSSVFLKSLKDVSGIVYGGLAIAGIWIFKKF